MYEREYVRKRKRRRIVAIVGAACSVVVLTLAIIAFLGRFVGTFTVSLESRNVDLTLLEKKDSSHQTSFLRVNSVVPFKEFTYKFFEEYGGAYTTDDEDNSSEYGLDPSSETPIFNFFKYTYYVKNVGDRAAKYDYSIKILENSLSKDGRSLIDTLRVMVFVDGVKTIYGKALSTPHYEEEDITHEHPDYRAPVSSWPNEPEYFFGYAEKFDSSEVVTAFRGQDIGVGEMKRYTIVTWLEGFQSSDEEFAPRGATLKLGVEINAYEIQ